MISSPTYPYLGWLNASGTLVSTSKPSDRQSATAGAFVSTTALNWIARNPSWRAHSITYSPSARPVPRPERRGSTMKLADATCEPGPGRLAYMLAVPSTVPSESVATTVRPGGSIIHMLRPSASSISGSYAYVSRAATISWKNGQIAAQSSGRASLIVTDRRSSDTSAAAGLRLF